MVLQQKNTIDLKGMFAMDCTPKINACKTTDRTTVIQSIFSYFLFPQGLSAISKAG